MDVIDYIFHGQWPDPQSLPEGRIVSLTSDAEMRLARRDDPPGLIVGIHAGGGLVYSFGGEFGVEVEGPMRRARPGGLGDIAVANEVVTVNSALTVSSDGDGRLVLAAAAGDPIVGRVLDWDGTHLHFQLLEPRLLEADLPGVTGWVETPKIVVPKPRVKKGAEGVDPQVVPEVSLKVRGGPAEWDY